MPTAHVFACDQQACKDDRFYATTWALVTYLLNQHPTAMIAYMNALVATPEAQQPQLWGAVFPNLPPAKLDSELATWIHYGTIKVSNYRGQARDYATTERVMTDADVLAAKGLLRVMFAPGRPSAPPEIVQAIAADSTHVIANLIKAVIDDKVDVERGRAVAAAHPGDWRAWSIAWRAELPPAERREARDKTCSLLEANPTAVPFESCAQRTEDPRRAAFMAAVPKLISCMVKSKREELRETMEFDIDIDVTGTVRSVQATMGTAATNECAAQVLKGVTFPAQRPGVYHVNTKLTRP
jgi:hypothetical protein